MILQYLHAGGDRREKFYFHGIISNTDLLTGIIKGWLSLSLRGQEQNEGINTAHNMISSPLSIPPGVMSAEACMGKPRAAIEVP